MPTLGKPELNWNAACLKQEYIKWDNIVNDNFKVNEKRKT